MKKPVELAAAEARLAEIETARRSAEREIDDIDISASVMTGASNATRDSGLQTRRAELLDQVSKLRADESTQGITVAGLKIAFADSAREPLKTARRKALLRYADALVKASDAWSESEKARTVLQYIGEAVRKSVPCPYLVEAEKSARELAVAA